jgi:hypothetical protein
MNNRIGEPSGAKAIIAVTVLVILLILCLGYGGQSQQKVITDSKGNYTAVHSTRASGKGTGTATGKTFTDAKGNVYPVYTGSKGGTYYLKGEKKVYLKVN